MPASAALESAVIGKTFSEAVEIIKRMWPVICEAIQRVRAMMVTAMQIIAEWVRDDWPALWQSLYWSPEFQYRHGTPHQRHIAWRKLKRADVHLPNPAR